MNLYRFYQFRQKSKILDKKLNSPKGLVVCKFTLKVDIKDKGVRHFRTKCWYSFELN
nr:unnamed protein product [Callosobruchus chinensis]